MKITITTTGKNSKELGFCEICGKEVSEVYHLIEFDEINKTYLNCKDFFGHKECLQLTTLNK